MILPQLLLRGWFRLQKWTKSSFKSKDAPVSNSSVSAECVWASASTDDTEIWLHADALPHDADPSSSPALSGSV